MGLISKKITLSTPTRFKPTSHYDLRMTIVQLLREGITDLNCIDVSGVSDMAWLFREVSKDVDIGNIGKIDISEWDVSNVTNMEGMFFSCDDFVVY